MIRKTMWVLRLQRLRTTVLFWHFVVLTHCSSLRCPLDGGCVKLSRDCNARVDVRISESHFRGALRTLRVEPGQTVCDHSNSSCVTSNSVLQWNGSSLVSAIKSEWMREAAQLKTPTPLIIIISCTQYFISSIILLLLFLLFAALLHSSQHYDLVWILVLLFSTTIS